MPREKQNGLLSRQGSNFHNKMSTPPPALVISMAGGSGLAWQQRIGTPQALVRGYDLKLAAIQPPSKAQLRKAIFTKDYVKGKQFIHSSEHSAFYPWIKPGRLAAACRGHVTLSHKEPLSPDCILMPSLVLLSKKLRQDADRENLLL